MFKVKCYSDIPGWSDFSQVYKELVSSLRDDCDILELGVGFGRSTWAMLDAMNNNMRLHVVDIFKSPSTMLWDRWFEVGSPITLHEDDIAKFIDMCLTSSQQEIFSYSLQQHPRYAQIKEIYAMSSQDYIASNHKSSFDLVFLDGDHSYESVKQELDYFKDSKIIAGHDYGNHEPGVIKAVDEFIFANRDRKFTMYAENDIFVIEKI